MKGYRTLAFNLLAAVFVAAELVIEMGYSSEVQFFITEEYMPLFMMAVIIANVILRFKTTTPVGKKQ
jgi:hypothetical protein